MTAGRKPKPTALKLITGNPGKRALPKNEIKPEQVTELPDPPVGLNALGREEWRRMGARLLALGLLTVLDTSVFEMYCAMWGHWRQAEDDLARLAVRDETSHGMVIRKTDGGMTTNPLWRVIRQAQAEAKTLAAEFGMTPSSRARLGVVVNPGAHGAEPDGPKKATGAARFF